MRPALTNWTTSQAEEIGNGKPFVGQKGPGRLGDNSITISMVAGKPLITNLDDFCFIPKRGCQNKTNNLEIKGLRNLSKFQRLM